MFISMNFNGMHPQIAIKTFVFINATARAPSTQRRTSSNVAFHLRCLIMMHNFGFIIAGKMMLIPWQWVFNYEFMQVRNLSVDTRISFCDSWVFRGNVFTADISHVDNKPHSVLYGQLEMNDSVIIGNILLILSVVSLQLFNIWPQEFLRI